MLCRFDMGALWAQFLNGQFFPIRFWTAPQFAEARTPSGKGYARGFSWRMMRAREIVTLWITSIRRMDAAFCGTFLKVEKTRNAIGLLRRDAAKLTRTFVVASGGVNLRERVCEV